MASVYFVLVSCCCWHREAARSCSGVGRPVTVWVLGSSLEAECCDWGGQAVQESKGPVGPKKWQGTGLLGRGCGVGAWGCWRRLWRAQVSGVTPVLLLLLECGGQQLAAQAPRFAPC